jgi:hypothetical protein|tara:strand:+ start:3215 stop:3355 length:141 start_codon:yes stop_codon:yes gene_type:complete
MIIHFLNIVDYGGEITSNYHSHSINTIPKIFRVSIGKVEKLLEKDE